VSAPAGLSLLFAVCLLLSFLFTLFSAAREELRLRARAEEPEDAAPGGAGERPGRPAPDPDAAEREEEAEDRLQHALGVLNLAVDLGAAASAAFALRLLAGGDPAAGAWTVLVLGVALVLLIPCESLPRALGAAHPRTAERLVRPFVAPWLALARPFTSPLGRLAAAVRRVLAPRAGEPGRLTSEEVRSAVESADEHLDLESQERDMVHSIFTFGETTVREVMVPRPDIVAVEEGVSLPDVIQAAREAQHSRLPVYRETLDHIVGIVTVKDLLARRYGLDGGAGLEGLLREPSVVPESKKIDELLREFQASGTHMAIVVDEYGGTAGLVTIEDVLEEIVGEIQDEHDVEEPPYSAAADGTLRVLGRMDLDDFADAVGARLEGEGFETVGGLVYSLLGRVPEPGDEVTAGGLVFRVAEMDGRRIRAVTVVRPAEAAPAGGAASGNGAGDETGPPGAAAGPAGEGASAPGASGAAAGGSGGGGSGAGAPPALPTRREAS
jgi:CBS domain containing-hemolysin-like protein